MYEELVEELRSKAEFLNVSDMRRNAPGLNLRNSFAEAMLKAADAIEELSKPRWIPVTERLPEDGQIVLCCWYNIHCSKRDNYTVMRFRKGRTTEQLVDVKRYNGSDQCGNNLRPYCWDAPHGPLSLFGQEVSHWMQMPEPPKEEK